MSVMGEWVRHLDQLIDALAASEHTDREDLVEALSKARPADSLDLNASAKRVREILRRGGLFAEGEPNPPAGGSSGVAEEAAIVSALAHIIRGD